ncbi:DUF2263 domain-containing protein [Balamuthia mandrillaris]
MSSAGKSHRASLAAHTLQVLEEGKYLSQNGKRVSIKEDLQTAVEGTILYVPDVRWKPKKPKRRKRANDSPPTTDEAETTLKEEKEGEAEKNTTDEEKVSSAYLNSTNATLPIIEVENCTTLEAARRLVEEGEHNVCVLNFASAHNPGGGFLKGSSAQEESLARSSGLYATLTSPIASAMYSAHASLRASRPRRSRSSSRGSSSSASSSSEAFSHHCLYTHHMIYSPQVPVFRDDEGLLLDEPYLVSFISSPAVNAGAVRSQLLPRCRQEDVERAIAVVMKERIRRILCVARHHEHRVLVLGAFGCGVFRNRAVDVARYFRDCLRKEENGYGFERVVFAVLDDKREKKLLPFRAAFELAGDLVLENVKEAEEEEGDEQEGGRGRNKGGRRKKEEASAGARSRRWRQGRENRGQKRNPWNNGGWPVDE